MENQISDIESYLLNFGDYTLPVISNDSTNNTSCVQSSIGETDIIQDSNNNNNIISDQCVDHSISESILQNVPLTELSQTNKANIIFRQGEEGNKQKENDPKIIGDVTQHCCGSIEDDEHYEDDLVNKNTSHVSNSKKRFHLSTILPRQTRSKTREKNVNNSRNVSEDNQLNTDEVYSENGDNQDEEMNENENSEESEQQQSNGRNKKIKNNKNGKGHKFTTGNNNQLTPPTKTRERPCKCHKCGMAFKAYKLLVEHGKDDCERPFKCKECDKSFRNNGDLSRHFKYIHSRDRPHKCPSCDYACVENTKLQRHILTHTGEKTHKCPHCEHKCIGDYNLSRHIRTHTGEKPYKCDICQQRFTQSNSFKDHMLRHEGATPKFKCEHCPLTCHKKSDLTKHVMRIHTVDKELICNKCGSTFLDKYLYKIHLQTHEGQKCFKCTICPYVASLERLLQQHILTHTGERPHKCDICEHSFKQKNLLTKHYEKKHNTKKSFKEKNLACSYCQKSFAFVGHLSNHVNKFHKGEINDEDEENEEALKDNLSDSYEDFMNTNSKAELNKHSEEQTDDAKPPPAKRAKIIAD